MCENSENPQKECNETYKRMNRLPYLNETLIINVNKNI